MQLVGDGGLSHTDNLLQPAFGREAIFTHLLLPSFDKLSGDSHRPAPADLGNDEKAGCWGPEGMKGTGEDHGAVI